VLIADGKNLQFFADRGSGDFLLSTYLEEYVDKILLPVAHSAMMPPDGVSQALIAWILWFFYSHGE
jgi:hypothetical protein